MNDSLLRTRMHSLDDLRTLPLIMVRALAEHVEDDSEGCWEWTGARNKEGYGLVTVRMSDGHMSSTCAHRLAYVAMRGPIQPGLTIDHLCRNRACFRPAHLRAVSIRVNAAAGHGAVSASIRARMETGRCAHGHDNWKHRRESGPDSWECRDCNRARMRAHQRVVRAAGRGLGMTQNEYRALFGQSRSIAVNILDGLERGIRPEVLILGARTAQKAGW